MIILLGWKILRRHQCAVQDISAVFESASSRVTQNVSFPLMKKYFSSREVSATPWLCYSNDEKRRKCVYP